MYMCVRVCARAHCNRSCLQNDTDYWLVRSEYDTAMAAFSNETGRCDDIMTVRTLACVVAL